MCGHYSRRGRFDVLFTSPRLNRPRAGPSLPHGAIILDVLRTFITLLLVLVAAAPARAQDVSAVELQIERLRVQLRDVVDREARLQERSQQLGEDLRPENIERSVSGVGTTDAAALRAQRRDQLAREKADVDGQLSEVSAKRARLEAEIATAEAESVRLKAAALAPEEAAPRAAPNAARAPAPSVTARPATRAPSRKRTPRKRSRPKRRA
jgi:hypothetical protein